MIREKKRSIERLLIVVTALITLSLAFLSFHSILGQINQTVSIGSQGTIETPPEIGVYWDINCSSPVVSVDWGTVEPGSMENHTIYLENKGNDAVSLRLFASNWSPSNASNYMTLSCDFAGQTVDAQEVVQILLTLSTSSGIEGIVDFSFDIIIDAVV